MKQTPQQIKAEEKQMMLAFVLIIAVLFSFHILWPQDTGDNTPVQETQPVAPTPTPVIVQQTPTLPVVKQAESIDIRNEFVIGSMGKNGGIFNSLDLEKYKQTADPDSQDISLLSNNYFAYIKWNINNETPDFTKNWTIVSGKTLTPETPVV